MASYLPPAPPPTPATLPSPSHCVPSVRPCVCGVWGIQCYDYKINIFEVLMQIFVDLVKCGVLTHVGEILCDRSDCCYYYFYFTHVKKENDNYIIYGNKLSNPPRKPMTWVISLEVMFAMTRWVSLVVTLRAATNLKRVYDKHSCVEFSRRHWV